VRTSKKSSVSRLSLPPRKHHVPPRRNHRNRASRSGPPPDPDRKGRRVRGLETQKSLQPAKDHEGENANMAKHKIDQTLGGTRSDRDRCELLQRIGTLFGLDLLPRRKAGLPYSVKFQQRYQMRHGIWPNPFHRLGFRSSEDPQNSAPFSSSILGAKFPCCPVAILPRNLTHRAG